MKQSEQPLNFELNLRLSMESLNWSKNRTYNTNTTVSTRIQLIRVDLNIA